MADGYNRAAWLHGAIVTNPAVLWRIDSSRLSSEAKSIDSIMPRTERKRASKPKVRTGCKTCKTRHVKCDEGRPDCDRCLKSGFDCDGYPDNAANISEKAILPKCGQAFVDWIADLEPSSKGLFKLPWGSMFESEADHRYFKFFESTTAIHLSGYFDTDLWGRVILQACEHEEFARHGVLALAALSKTIETTTAIRDSSGSTESLCQTANSHHEVALKHYAKSLSLMRQRTADATDQHHLRNLLVSCLLTICFENYHGNEKAALAQAVSGIKLLSQFQEELSNNGIAMPSMSSNSVLSTIDPNLINVFTRLEIVIMHVMESIPEQHHISLQIKYAAKALDTMPSEFSNLKEARYYWDIMMRQSVHCYHDESDEPFPKWPMFLPWPGAEALHEAEIPVESHDQVPYRLGQYLEIGLRWLNAFEFLFKTLKQRPNHRDFRGAMVLKIYFLVCRLAHPSTCDFQVITDSAELVRLAKEILDPFNCPLNMEQHRSAFAFDGSSMLAIFRVAIRCRIRQIRRDAIALLKLYPRREGFCDSEMAAKVAEWFVATEEDGLRADEEVSPDSRLILVSNSFVLAERKTLVQCAKQVKGKPTELLPPVLLMW